MWEAGRVDRQDSASDVVPLANSEPTRRRLGQSHDGRAAKRCVTYHRHPFPNILDIRPSGTEPGCANLVSAKLELLRGWV